MKTLQKIAICFLVMGFYSLSAEAQITKPKKGSKIIKRPVITGDRPLATPFDEIIYTLKQGKCMEAAVTSLYVFAGDNYHNSHTPETRHGDGVVTKVSDTEINIKLTLHMGLKVTPGQGSMETTINIKKTSTTVRVAIRNRSYYELMHRVKIEKKKNGYFLVASPSDAESASRTFSIAIYNYACLI